MVARRSTPRRSSSCCCATHGSRRRPRWPCRTRAWASAPAPLVVRGEPLTLAEVQQHFAQLEVAKFKWPEHLEHVVELPRTKVEKVDKKALHADIVAKLAAVGSTVPGDSP